MRVQNFRSILDETLPCEQLTALVGPNGSGKSSFLRAIDLFYTPNASYDSDDFYSGDTSSQIKITISFSGLNQEETSLFSKYVENKELVIEKEMRWPAHRISQKYFGISLRDQNFEAFRSAPTAKDRKVEYERIRSRSEYSGLPKYTKQETAFRALELWEQSHPGSCVRNRDDGQFFGFKEVGEAHLERFTKFLSVPAVRDAAEDAAEGKGSILSDILDVVVRNTLANREDIRKLQADTQARYDEILDPEKLPELDRLGQDLTTTLRIYVQDSTVNLTWTKGTEIDIPMPRAVVKLVEDGYPSEVANTGHGLQRAFLLTMLQHLVLAQAQPPLTEPQRNEEANETSELETDGEEVRDGPEYKLSNLILGIEEPELYQHPNRQRHLSRVLMKLTQGGIKGVAEKTQVIYSTHSPLFVDIERFDQLRVLSKLHREQGKPKVTRVRLATLDDVARILEVVDSRPAGSYSGDTLRSRLQALMTPWMNEGFFARVVVLVEGEEDRATILGMAGAMGLDFDDMGISVIPCMGKNNIDRPTVIFSKLGIGTYAIWDSDEGGRNSKPEDNHRLLRLFGEQIEDWPEKATEKFACFRYNLSRELRIEIGEDLFDKLLQECCLKFSYGRSEYGRKNPQVVQELISQAMKLGRSMGTIQRIVSCIVDCHKAMEIGS